MASKPIPAEETHKIELILSWILRIGVSVSLAVITFGLIISFVHHPTYNTTASELGPLTSVGATFPHTLHQTWRSLRDFRGQAIVVAGLLLLILTPVMRVAVSVLSFMYEKDWPFVWITLVVLTLLIVSFLLGKAG
jgi:uncharacterized membrane protein